MDLCREWYHNRNERRSIIQNWSIFVRRLLAMSSIWSLASSPSAQRHQGEGSVPMNMAYRRDWSPFPQTGHRWHVNFRIWQAGNQTDEELSRMNLVNCSARMRLRTTVTRSAVNLREQASAYPLLQIPTRRNSMISIGSGFQVRSSHRSPRYGEGDF